MKKFWKIAAISCMLLLSASVVLADNDNTLTLPSGLEVIEEEAFYGVVSADKAVVPDGTVSVGARAFAEGGFSEIRLPSTVTEIGEGAFQNCGKSSDPLRYYCIPRGINVGAGAFAGCRARLYFNGQELPYFNYTVQDNSVTITGLSGYAAIQEAVIPDTIDGKPVTAIKNGAFYGRSTVARIVIPSTVTEIGYEAFRNCSSLTEINLPAGVTTIGNSTFQGCSSLTEINLPAALTTIGNNAFRSCYALTRADLPSGVTSIGMNAFHDCEALAEMVIPSGVTEIAQETFRNCRTMLRVVLPEGLTTISENAFYDCYALAEMEIPSTVTEIGYRAFGYNKALTQAAIPAAITALANEAFYGCSSLESVQLPAGLVSIGEYTFEGCTKLTDINFPAGLTTIGKRAFHRACQNQPGYPVYQLPDSLETIGENAFAECGAALCVSRDGDIESMLLESGCILTYYDRLDYRYQYKNVNNEYILYLTGYAGTGGNVSIPEGPVVIGENAFKENTLITSVVIPDSVTKIDRQAFESCSGLTGVTMAGSVTSIEDSAFRYCANLTDVVFSNALTNIGGGAFRGTCTSAGIHYYYLPDDIATFGWRPFEDCGAVLCVARGSSTEELVRSNAYGGSYTHYNETDFRYRYYNSEGLERLMQYVGTENTSVEVLPYVWLIDYDAFRDHTELTSVFIPETVTRINDSAFRDCANLTDITLPDSLTRLEDSVFNGCGSNAEDGFVLTLPSNINEIGSHVFDNSPVILLCDKDSTTADRISNRGWSFARADREDELEFRYRWTYFNHVSGWGLYDYVGDEASVRLPDDCVNVWSDNFSQKPDLELVCAQLSDTAEGLSRAGLNFTFPGHEGLRYRIIEGVLYIMGYAGTSSEIVIPQAADYIQDGNWDIQIRANAFQGMENITRVVIPEGVSRINNDAFTNCYNLTDITFPDSLKSLDQNVFRYCGRDSQEDFCFTLPDYMEDLVGRGGGANTFGDCNAILKTGQESATAALLTDRNYCYTVAGEEDYRYRYESYTENGGTGRRLWLVGYVGTDTTAYIPEGNIYGIKRFSSDTTAVNWHTFYGNAFYGNETVTKVVIPEGVTRINSDVFTNCYNLTDITFPDSLKSLDQNVFRYCGRDSEEVFYFVLPDNLEEMTGRGGGAQTFSDCSAVLETGKYSQTAGLLTDRNFCYTVAGEHDFRYRYVSYTDGDETGRRLWLVGYSGTGGDVTIPQGIYGIDRYQWDPPYGDVEPGFTGNETLIRVIIPEGTEVIEDSVFRGCLNLTDIVFPSTLKVLKNHAFEQCGKNADYLHYYVLPDNMEEISTGGWGAFQDINMGRISCAADSETAKLVSNVYTGHYNGCYYFAIKGHEDDGLLYCYDRYTTDTPDVYEYRLILKEYEGSDTEVTIPSEYDIYAIENGAFAGKALLESVIIPYGIERIGSNVFDGCNNLYHGAEDDAIIIPGSVKSIGNLAFQNLGSLRSERFYLVLPGNLEEFDLNIFNNCNAVLVVPEGSYTAGRLYSSYYLYYNTLDDARAHHGLQQKTPPQGTTVVYHGRP